MTRSFRDRIVSASLWTAGGFATQKAFQLGSNLVLTRLLFPEAFGLMALANVVLIAIGMFGDIGIKPAIIQNPRGEEEPFLNTAWTIQVSRGFIMWFAACVLAYPVSLAYRQEILWPLISILGSTAAINGFSSMSLATCERRMMVKRITVIQLVGQSVSLVLTALMAWGTRSIWALAWGGVTGAVIAAVLSHVCLPRHRHLFTWDKEAAESLVRFGRWIFLSTALTFTAGHGLRILQGLLLTPAELGVLSIAQTIAAIPTDLIFQLMAMAVFPAICEARHDGHERMVAVMRDLHAKLLVLALTGFFIMALIAVPAIQLLYDARYQAAGYQLLVLALVGAVGIIALPYQNAVMAIGDTRLYATFMAANTAIRIVGMYIGFKLGGITTMLFGIGAGSFLGYLYVAYSARRLAVWFPRIDLIAFTSIAVAASVSFSMYKAA